MGQELLLAVVGADSWLTDGGPQAGERPHLRVTMGNDRGLVNDG